MAMSHQRADTTLNATLRGGATPHVWLHTGNPGAAGTANVAQQTGPSNIVRKAVTFGAPENHPTNIERRCLNSAIVSWSGAEITAGQTITHATIWSASTAGTPEFKQALTASKMVGSDGGSFAVGEIEAAITVFVRP